MGDRLSEIEAMLNAATPGMRLEAEHGGQILLSAPGVDVGVTAFSTDPEPGYSSDQARADARFLGNAQANIRYLIDEVKRLREALRFYADLDDDGAQKSGDDSNFYVWDVEPDDGGEAEYADIFEINSEGESYPMGTRARAALEGK